MNGMEGMVCTVRRVVFSNADSGYSVFQVSQEGCTDWHTLVGTFHGVAVGSTLAVEGEWIDNPKFGRQFRAQAWREELPATVKGMEKYLGSGQICGIGPKTARAIVAKFGVDTFTILTYSPERLMEVPGISRKKMERVRRQWEDHKGVSDIMAFLQGYGASPAYAVRIFKRYGRDSIAKVKENPYALADDVFGIGFKMADQIAQHLGYAPHDPRRCKAGIEYALKQLANDGHCFAGRDMLAKAAKGLLCVGDVPVMEAIDALVREQAIVDEDGRLFLPMYYYAELGVAKKIRLLMADDGDMGAKPVDIAAIEEGAGIEYDERQREAIIEAVHSKVMVLTGGPGCGKTVTTLGIITALESLNQKVLLAAPTGRAAKRMSEATGKEAKTIHRLLEYNPSEGFGFNEENQLHGDALIVDESSMIDILLMSSLLKAVPLNMRLILVGDIDQLPSVGAGNVLRDIIDSGNVPVVRLTRIFRQAQASRIVTNAHKVNQGMSPDVSNGKDTDFFFIRQPDAEQAAKEIVGIVSERIPKAYGYSTNDIQVLVPMKNGAAGSVALNIALQQAINPEGESIISGQFKYRVGDKVMQVRNNYKKNVFNGDVGIVQTVDAEERTMTVAFDGSEVEYEGGDLGELTLAYACTIHKSQGSEYPVVVIPLLMSHYVMLQRNLVYTGITRAKKLCIIVGDPKALHYAVGNNVVLERNTMLGGRLQRPAGVRGEDRLYLANEY